MPHAFIGKKGFKQVAHDLMHLDHDPSVILHVKNQRLHMRINLAPLLRPVSAQL